MPRGTPKRSIFAKASGSAASLLAVAKASVKGSRTARTNGRSGIRAQAQITAPKTTTIKTSSAR